MWKKGLLFLFTFGSISLIRCQFFECHDDPAFEPGDGTLQDLQFTWLGVLQYIHVKNGTPHYFRVPRVVLISRLFALSTAVDAAQIPDGYALGNLVFGDYERDETECHVTIEEIAEGAECEPGVLLMPIADVLLHPEFKHFGVRNSLAILKLITSVKSQYMLPVCLPFKNYITRRDGKQATDRFYHLDYISDVPRDFVDEEKEVTRISLLPRELCYLYENNVNMTHFAKNRMACTTSCGLRSGAPTLVHEHTGHWSIVAIALGGSPCPDPLRPHRPPPPPQHLLLYPYVPWITAAITGKAVGAFAKDDPFGFTMPRASPYDLIGHAWVGHWWMGGIRCYERGEAAEDVFKFYHEIFQINPSTETFMSYYIEIDAAPDDMVICVKVGMPYRLGQPRVWELDSPVVKVRVPLIHFFSKFKFEVEAWGYNATGLKTAESEISESSECDPQLESCSD